MHVIYYLPNDVLSARIFLIAGVVARFAVMSLCFRVLCDEKQEMACQTQHRSLSIRNKDSAREYKDVTTI